MDPGGRASRRQPVHAGTRAQRFGSGFRAYSTKRPGKASYHNVNLCLRELHKWLEHEKVGSLALPRLATGVGGLEWDQVEPLIRQHLGALGIPIFLYTTYQKGVKASE